MNSFYSNKPDGITGNEDTGSMSSWYVWNAIGLYPFNPASGEYLIVTPLSEKTEITLASGKRFIIEARNLNKQNKYVQWAFLNGNTCKKSYITHHDITNGGELILIMGDRPSTLWGTDDGDLPGKR